MLQSLLSSHSRVLGFSGWKCSYWKTVKDFSTIHCLFHSKVVGNIVINEIAPRPHNSGHYTIEACETSQYENHLRAILSLPIGSTALKVPSAAMLNLLGSSNNMSELLDFAEFALGVPGASVHLYGKAECRKGRKMGHITLTANSDAEIRARLRQLLQRLPGAAGAGGA